MNGATVSQSESGKILEQAIAHKQIGPNTVAALHSTVQDIKTQVATYKDLAKLPQEQSNNVRNGMFLADETLRVMAKNHTPALDAQETAAMNNYRGQLDHTTKFIPNWVKVAVALALGLGTMVGWKRIVVTVGEQIGKDHLTYAQGASAELVAMATILAADRYGLPVSTTHVLTSGVAGTMAANGSGLQWGTVRLLAAAWVLTLPMSILLAAGLFWVFRHVF